MSAGLCYLSKVVYVSGFKVREANPCAFRLTGVLSWFLTTFLKVSFLDSFDMQFETDELSVAGLGLRGIRASAAYLSVAKLEDGKDGKPKP